MKSWTRIQKATVLGTVVYAAIFVAMLVLHPGSRHFYDAFFNTYEILPPLLAGIAGVIYYRCDRHSNAIRRAGWLLIAIGCLSYAIGQSLWTYFESIAGIEVPFPSWADAGYLANYVFMIAGVLLLFGSMPIAGRARQLLDNATVASSVGILSWYFIIKRVWHQSDIALVGKLISVAYPLGDIAALFGAVVLLSSGSTNRSLRRSLYFLSAGILGITFFDTSFTWMSLNGTYHTGCWSDWTVSFGWILIAYSFLTRMWWVKQEDERERVTSGADLQRRTMRQIIIPYVAVTVACLVVGIHDYASDGIMSILTVGRHVPDGACHCQADTYACGEPNPDSATESLQ